MGSAAVALPSGVGGFNLGDLLKLVGLPSAKERRTENIVGAANELIRTVVTVIDDLVSASIEKRTAEDFVAARAELFPQYFVAMRALGDLGRIVLPKQTLDRLSAEWFSQLEADFRELGPSSFGADLTERGIFTVWTLRKIHDLAQEITAHPLSEENREKNDQMAMHYATAALLTRFHVDCLANSMRGQKPIYPEVTEPIRDGLRAAVNTYACIRQWADLRNPRPEPELGPVEWTGDDERLLADSMRDLEQESD